MQIGYTIVPLQFPKVQIICFISEDKHVFLFRPLLSSPWPFLIYLMATMFNAALFIISTPLRLLSSVYSIVNITKGTNLSPTGFHFYHQNCIVKVFWIFPFETWDLIKLNAILSFDTSTSVHCDDGAPKLIFFFSHLLKRNGEIKISLPYFFSNKKVGHQRLLFLEVVFMLSFSQNIFPSEEIWSLENVALTASNNFVRVESSFDSFCVSVMSRKVVNHRGNKFY